MSLMVAGSPVEIEVAAEEAAFTEDKRAAALSLFHDLTSGLELQLLATPAHGGEPWPRHRFWFGLVAEADGVLARLRALPGAAEAPTTGAIVYVTRDIGPWRGVLAAGSGPGWADPLG